ncbi:MAG: hypothetical protein LBD37_09965, partial [Treponema sp.]|nr:hypothetical protein [Treponema sp.]
MPLPPPPPPSTPESPDDIIPAPEAQGEEIVFSRIVRVTVGQLVEVPFRGTGWVFLGEQAARRGIVYDSRRLDSEGQSFVFRTEDAGSYTLKFFKQDFIRDFIFNDFVQVIVGSVPETVGTGWFNSSFDRGRVRAEPRWPNSLEEAQALRRGRGPESGTAVGAPGSTGSPKTETLPDSSGAAASPEIAAAVPPAPAEAPASTSSRPPVPPVSDEGVVPVRPPALGAGNSAAAPQTSVAASEAQVNATPETFLEKAREEFDAGRIAQAISQLDMFHNRYPSGSDEAWWLYGQFYEANSPSRNILAALDYYRRLVREYPQSSRYNDARRRI